MSLNLRKTYHPGGLPITDSDGVAADSCPCGCKDVVTDRPATGTSCACKDVAKEVVVLDAKGRPLPSHLWFCPMATVRWWATCEDLGIRGTPAQLAIAELERAKKATEPRPAAPSKPWKGATRQTGEILLPDVTPCTTVGCTLEHVTLQDLDVDGDAPRRHHVVEHEGVIWTHPSGAMAFVRADRRFKP